MGEDQLANDVEADFGEPLPSAVAHAFRADKHSLLAE
jgi:hypothetical protein